MTDPSQSEGTDHIHTVLTICVPQGLEEAPQHSANVLGPGLAGIMSGTREVPSLDKDTCEAIQREEWEVLEVSFSSLPVAHASGGLNRTKSIFPDFLSNGRNAAEGRIELEIPVELAEETSQRVMVVPLDEQPQGDFSHFDCDLQPSLSLTTLPPITLILTIPLDYPLHQPPIISELRSSYGWLAAEKLKLLERNLLRVWEVEHEMSGEGRVILYDWVEMVRSAESCLGKLGMMTAGNIL